MATLQYGTYIICTYNMANCVENILRDDML